LGGRQFGRSPRDGSGRQAIDTLIPEGCHPATDAAGIDAENVGDLLARVSFADTLDSEKPPSLQLSGAADSPHARQRSKPRADRALLSWEPIAEDNKIDCAEARILG
jgi:hypothetical protein